MMDLIACEAPLDNSFQKNKLELVNKGSLGRRRRPSRSNLKLLLSSSYSSPESPTSNIQTPDSTPETYESVERTPDLTPGTPKSVSQIADLITPSLILQTSYSAPQTPSPVPQTSTPIPTGCSRKPLVNGSGHKERSSQQDTSTPIPTGCSKKPLVNGSVHKERSSQQDTSTPIPTICSKNPLVNGSVHKERSRQQNFKSLPRIESSLPRTPSESKLVAEAQQFSIEAKLKRKKSDLGRSAVLIQTWERRTRNDSLPKRQQSLKNRFQNKENISDHQAMPDSHICQKYSANSMNVESLKNCGLVSKVRAAYSEETMVYRMSENGRCFDKQVQVNGDELNGEEPEWISLSRKLRAKFAEGHVGTL